MRRTTPHRTPYISILNLLQFFLVCLRDSLWSGRIVRNKVTLMPNNNTENIIAV